MQRKIKSAVTLLFVAIFIVGIIPSNMFMNLHVEASADRQIVIVIDPGHGGSDPGAVSYMSTGERVEEATCNWNISVALKKYLERYDNVVVYMTKGSYYEESSLSGRVNFVEQVGADLCVSIHNNSGYPDARGCEVYKSRVEPFCNNTNDLSWEIANNLAGIGFLNRGVKTWASTLPETPDDDYLTMICGPISVGIPSILIEHGFVTNQKDAYLLKNYVNKIAEADGKAIANYFNLKLKGAVGSYNPTINTTPYVQTFGYMASMPNGAKVGFSQYRPGDDRDKRLEGFKIDLLNDGYNGNIKYQAYVQGQGWTDEVSNGEFAGTTGKRLPIEGIKVKLEGQISNDYDVYYRVFSERSGWLGWTKNGNPAGETDSGTKARAIQVLLRSKKELPPGSMENAYKGTIAAPDSAKIAYYTHVQTYGWEKEEAFDGKMSGTSGQSKRLEAIKIRNNTKISGDIMYQVHCQTFGWMDWVKNGQLAGTQGMAKRLEAIKIKLTGKLAEKYDVYYRVHAQTYGWLDWAKNGEPAGSSGFAKRLEGIEIQLVEKGKKAPGETEKAYVYPLISYRTHVQREGWQYDVMEGQISGTCGSALRLEGIVINNLTDYEGGFIYQVHCQTYGWMDEVQDGEMAGTEGQAKRLEAIRIRLYGELEEKFDVYYRVHCQTYGWLDWAKNGESAGTEGMAKRLEAIQIVLVPKGGLAPGSEKKPFLEKVAAAPDNDKKKSESDSDKKDEKKTKKDESTTEEPSKKESTTEEPSKKDSTTEETSEETTTQDVDPQEINPATNTDANID